MLRELCTHLPQAAELAQQAAHKVSTKVRVRRLHAAGADERQPIMLRALVVGAPQIMGGAAEAKNSLSKMATDVSTWQVRPTPPSSAGSGRTCMQTCLQPLVKGIAAEYHAPRPDNVITVADGRR